MMERGTAATKNPEVHGIGVIEQSLQVAHGIVDQVFQHLEGLNERLYSPKPQPVGRALTGATPGAIENSLNHLNGRLRELEMLAQTLLHG